MIEVSVSELRARLPEFIRLAETQGPVVVTSRGKEVVRLVAPSASRHEARKKLDALSKTARIDDILTPVLAGWEVLE